MSSNLFDTIDEALIYVIENSLVAVERLYLSNSLKPDVKSEYTRQKNICQIGINHIMCFSLTVKESSAPRIIAIIEKQGGSIEHYLNSL
jgi:hypothetical protein